MIAGKRSPLASRYSLGGRGTYGFQLEAYDRSRPLVIDPGLVYSTYLGGGFSDSGADIATDASGNAYVTGKTYSGDFPGFPVTPGAFDTTYNGGSADTFVAKLNPSGSGLAYATFLGGSGDDNGNAIAVDASGNTYVAGTTTSSDFPATAGAFDTTYNGGGTDAFVAKLNASGSGVMYATYLGGSSIQFPGQSPGDAGLAIALDDSGSAYVTGQTNSTDFPATAGAFDTTYNGGTWDAFVAKLNTSGADLVYTTALETPPDKTGTERARCATPPAPLAMYASTAPSPAPPLSSDRSASSPHAAVCQPT